ncbi:MAG TPA: hypothetical protein VF070_46380 [Streptosporangiaceae bacterium]
MSTAPSASADPHGGQPGDDTAGQSAFMTALVTEHFALQSAASTTVSEAAGRATLYMSALSSSLVAMGFAAQSPHRFAPFAATVIPAVFLLGLFTIARLVDTGVQNVAFLAGIARIRSHYRRLSPAAAGLFAPWGRSSQNNSDQALAALSRSRGLLTGLGTTAAMVAAINGIVGGIGVALAVMWAVGAGPAAIAAAVACGAAFGAAFFGGFLAYQARRYNANDDHANA